MQAPENIQIARIETLQWALIYCRNYSLKPDADMDQVNDLMEAIHDIPGTLLRWPDGAIEIIKLHLSCFNYKKWEGAPDLASYFEHSLDRNTTG
jgi:hypothetical protein